MLKGILILMLGCSYIFSKQKDFIRFALLVIAVNTLP